MHQIPSYLLDGPVPVATGETLGFNINIVIALIYYEKGKCIPRKIVTID